MRDFNRIGKTLTLISVIWEKQPDTRFHQLIDNLSYEYAVEKDLLQTYYQKEESTYWTMYGEIRKPELYSVEDENFIKFLENKLESSEQNES